VIDHPSCVKLTTALYSHDSNEVARDPVFGVKKSLIKRFIWSEDETLAKEFGVEMYERSNGDAQGQKSRGFWTLEHDFVLVPK